jgi:hypothetical protein
VNRRFAILLLLTATVAVGCSTVDDANTAASVDDSTLSHDQLAELMTLVGSPAESAVEARNTTLSWIILRALADDAAAQGIEVTDTDRQQAEDSLQTLPGDLSQVSQSTLDELIEIQAAGVAINRAGAGLDINALIDQTLAVADVEVDPRIGVFDPVGRQVLPLG